MLIFHDTITSVGGGLSGSGQGFLEVVDEFLALSRNSHTSIRMLTRAVRVERAAGSIERRFFPRRATVIMAFNVDCLMYFVIVGILLWSI